jgi:hypothetical protein
MARSPLAAAGFGLTDSRYGGEAVVVWYYSREHFRIERKCASPFAADTTGCAWRLRVDCRARIFEFVSQSLTAD